MIFRGGLNDLSIPLSISSTLRRHNFFCIDAIIYSHKIRSRVDAAASTQGCIDASLPKLHRKFHLLSDCLSSSPPFLPSTHCPSDLQITPQNGGRQIHRPVTALNSEDKTISGFFCCCKMALIFFQSLPL